jgi:hypothetical protein
VGYSYLMTTTQTTVTESALIAYVVRLQEAISADFAANYPNVPVTALSIAPGRRYAKIVATDSSGSRSARCFVDVTTGDILKAASWSAPAKNFARGNVHSLPETLSTVRP